MTYLFILLYLISPLGILYLIDKFEWLNKIGAVMLAYGVGLSLASLNIFPQNIEVIHEILISISIPVAIPLLLFSSDLRQWTKLAPKSVLSLILGIISLIVIVFLGYILFNERNIEDFTKIGGLLIGVYTGGTPNLAALKLVLDVNDELYIAVHSYDMVIGTGYLFFLIFIGRRIVLFAKKKNKDVGKEDSNLVQRVDEQELYWGLLKRNRRWSLLFVFACAALIVGVSTLLMMLAPEKMKMAVLVISITTLGIGASFITKVRNVEKSFELGMYLILVFSIVIASKVNFYELTILEPSLFYYMTFVVFGTLLLHVILSRIFKIDTGTIIITSTALICSPPFVPVVASAIKNRSLIVPGLTVGIVGYAIGNYLGVIVVNILESF